MQEAAPAPLLGPRPRSGRWIAGVCAGIAARWGWPVGRVRLAFALSTSIVLLGPLIYLAAVLILPSEGSGGQAPGLRAIVLAAQAVAATTGIVLLVALSGALAILGYGWAAAVLAAALLVGAAAQRRLRLSPWVLLPLVALTVPAAGANMADLSLTPRFTTAHLAPDALSASRTLHVDNGLGLVRIDLRRTRLPSTGTVRLDVAAGTKLTIVALPHDRCVRVVVDRHVVSRAWSRAMSLVGSDATRVPTKLFGTELYGSGHMSYGPPGTSGLTLAVHFTSVTGGLTVRDYPEGVDPWQDPTWPDTSFRYATYPYFPGITDTGRPRAPKPGAHPPQGARRAAGPCGLSARLAYDAEVRG